MDLPLVVGLSYDRRGEGHVAQSAALVLVHSALLTSLQREREREREEGGRERERERLYVRHTGIGSYGYTFIQDYSDISIHSYKITVIYPYIHQVIH